MAIYLKDKKITPYRGDYKPVNIYQGTQKIAGWHNEERASDTAVEWDDTYNDSVGGVVYGRSEQDGTPDPANPSPILHSGKCEVKSSNGGLYPYRPPTSVMLPELRAIPLPANATEWTYIRDGVKYWADTAVYVGGGDWDVVRRCGLKVFDGTENWLIQVIQIPGASGFYVSMLDWGYKTNVDRYSYCLCTHAKIGVSGASGTEKNMASPNKGFTNWLMNMDSAVCGNTPENFKVYLAAQHAAGVPVTTLYALATPTTERVHLGTLKSFPRYTHVEQTQDEIKAWMELECKVINNI